MLSSKKNSYDGLKNDPDQMLELFNSVKEPGKPPVLFSNKVNIPLPPIKSDNNGNDEENNEKKKKSVRILDNVDFENNRRKKEEEKKRVMKIFATMFERKNNKEKKDKHNSMELVGFEKDLQSERYSAIQRYFDGSICEHCAKQLEETFNHCIGKVNFVFPSVVEINEEKDGDMIAGTPDVYIYDEVKRNREYPTDIYITHEQKTKTDKEITYNKRRLRMKEGGPSFNIAGKFKLDITRKGVEEPFPGILFHDLENQKDKEIEKLNRIILNLKDRLKDEMEYTKQCNDVLGKMKKSCLFMDTWKDLEEARLKDDVRNMKTQLAGFISYSFSQEREKYNLRIQNKLLKNEMDLREKEIDRVNNNYDKAQSRHNELTKKYTELCNSVKEWKLAAKRGSQEVQAQNEILNASLKKLATECKVAQAQLSNEIEKSKQLDFELFSITTQFKDQSKEVIRLKDVIQSYIKKNKEINQTYNDSLYKIIDLKETIKGLEKKVEGLEGQLVQERRKATINEADLSKLLEDCKKEKEIIQLRMEEYLSSLEKVTVDYGKVMADKCRLEDEVVYLKSKYKNAMTSKLKTIEELEKKETELQSKLNDYTDENNHLKALEKELRFQLDKGNLTVNVLKFDLNQAQTTLEDIKTKLSDKISKLVTTNSSLQDNNRILNSKVLNMRKKIDDDEKYIEILKNKLTQYEEKNDIKNAIYNTHKIEMYIEEKIAETEEANVISSKKIENLNAKIEKTEQILQQTEERKIQLEEECKKLKEEITEIKSSPKIPVEEKKEMNEKIAECKEEIQILKHEVEEKKVKNNNLNLQFNNYKVNMEHELEIQKNENVRLQEHIKDLSKDVEESHKILDKIYESYENSKTTMEHLLANNEMLKIELINQQKHIFRKNNEFEEFKKANKIMERNYFSLVKLKQQEYRSTYNDILSIQIQLKQEANRIERVLNSCSIDAPVS